MAETKRGRLGVSELEAATNTSVYAVTDGNDALIDIFISNFAGQADFAVIDVAIVDGAVGDVADEDYIVRDYKLDYGEFLPLAGFSLAADECVVVKSSVAGVVVRVDGTEQDAASGSSPALSVQKLSETFAHTDFTDNEDATGFADFSSDLPIGAIVLGWKAAVTTGLAGDTSAAMQVGEDGDLDRFSADTTQSVFSDSSVAMSAPLAASAACPAAVTPRVTVTTDSDFSSVSAGAVTVEIYYLKTQ